MRLELRARTELTLRTLAALSDRRRRRAVELAAAVGTTPAYLAHLVGPLVRAGWVRSAPGPNGGHRLAVALSTISLLDLIEAVEGPTDDGRCVMADRTCPSPDPCALHDAWMRARAALVSVLSSTTLDQLTQNEEETT
jgi:Rrf2 family iron-sulfur cluster assembly transcriptional regulator